MHKQLLQNLLLETEEKAQYLYYCSDDKRCTTQNNVLRGLIPFIVTE